MIYSTKTWKMVPDVKDCCLNCMKRLNVRFLDKEHYYYFKEPHILIKDNEWLAFYSEECCKE